MRRSRRRRSSAFVASSRRLVLAGGRVEEGDTLRLSSHERIDPSRYDPRDRLCVCHDEERCTGEDSEDRGGVTRLFCDFDILTTPPPLSGACPP
jgi:hypothetical protein